MRPSHEAGCCPYAQAATGSLEPASGQSAQPSAVNAATLASHLYDCEGLSTYEIARAVGISRQRVGRLLRKAGVPVKPRGAGRRRAPAPRQAALTDLAVHLYLQSDRNARTDDPWPVARTGCSHADARTVQPGGQGGGASRIAHPAVRRCRTHGRRDRKAPGTARTGCASHRTRSGHAGAHRRTDTTSRAQRDRADRRPVCRLAGVAGAIPARHSPAAVPRPHLAALPRPGGRRPGTGEGALRILRAGTAPRRADYRPAGRDHPGALAGARHQTETPWRQITLPAQMAREPRRINWGRAANRVPADLGASRR